MRVLYGLLEKLNRRSVVSAEEKGERRENGSITIFLSCILLPLIIAEMTIINLCALTATKQIVNDAGKMASNAALTDYNKTLHNMYGLIAFDGDGAEASQRADYIFKQNISTKYDWNNKDVEVGRNRDWFTRMNQTWSLGKKKRSADVTVTMDTNSVLSNTDVFKGQICDAMRYNYKATRQITPEDIEYYSRYPDSVDAINAKIKYDEELYNYYDDCMALVEELKLNIVDPQEKLYYVKKIYENTDHIKSLCDEVLKHKALLEQYKSDWNNANQKTGLSVELRNVLKKSYDEETKLKFHFDEVQKISDVMDEFDFSTKVYEKYLSEESLEYIGDEAGWDCPIDEVKMFMAFNDFTRTSDEYKKLETTYKKPELAGGYDELNTGWEQEQKNALSYKQIYNTSSYVDGNYDWEGNYDPIFPQDLTFDDNYIQGYNRSNYSKLTECVDGEFIELKKGAAFYKNMSGASYAVRNDSVQLLESEDGTEFFCGFHRTDDYTLTGWDIRRSNVNSENLYTQQEYLLFGQSSARANVEQTDELIYYSEYIDNLIKEFSNNYYGSYDGVLCPGDSTLKNYFRKDVICLKSAKEKADSEFISVVCNWGLTDDDFSYVHFMKLFMLIQVTNNEDIILSRMRNVIEMNVDSSTNGTFSFDTAYTSANINAKIHIDGVIGGGSTYEYNTFAMY